MADPVTLPALVDMESYCCEECEAPASLCGTSPCEGKENVCSLDSVTATKGIDESYRKCGEVRREGRGRGVTGWRDGWGRGKQSWEEEMNQEGRGPHWLVCREI